MRAAVLTVSDRCFAGEREDLGGPVVSSWLEGLGCVVACRAVVPDDAGAIVRKLQEWADSGKLELIVTTGGTGVSPRDVTPEATMQVVERVIPGFGEVMRAESLKQTPMAILSRAVAGVRGKTLIINLPGSPQGAIENLAAVWPAVPHAVAKICGDNSDCHLETQGKGNDRF